MKPRKTFVLTALTAFLFLGTFLSPVRSEIDAPPVAKAQIPGVWFGHDVCAIEMLRVSFETNGTGKVVYKLGDTRPEVFEIKSWDLTNGQFTCVLSGERAKLIVTPLSCMLRCELNWSNATRNFRLLREKDIIESLRTMREASEKGR